MRQQRLKEENDKIDRLNIDPDLKKIVQKSVLNTIDVVDNRK